MGSHHSHEGKEEKQGGGSGLSTPRAGSRRGTITSVPRSGSGADIQESEKPQPSMVPVEKLGKVSLLRGAENFASCRHLVTKVDLFALVYIEPTSLLSLPSVRDKFINVCHYFPPSDWLRFFFLLNSCSFFNFFLEIVI